MATDTQTHRLERAVEEKSYPIAEIFFSVQGEGAQSGIPMVFLRLAGCTVGKPYSAQFKKNAHLLVFQNECTTWDGRKFPCDTNYQMAARMTPDVILERIRQTHPLCRWISLTGGEPLMHDLLPLLQCLTKAGYRIHLDTSGTIDWRRYTIVMPYFRWQVVSPKYPFIDAYADAADEIRILVDDQFEWDTLPKSIREHKDKIWISPINPVHMIDPENANRCVSIVRAHPEVRVSLQIHKLLGVR